MTATALASTALVARKNDFVLAGPVGSFDAYMDKVSRIPVLSREDEAELAIRFRNDGDLDAARQLVLSHLRFVVHIARGYMGYGLPVGDLVQEGNVGLMKAVKRFDPDGRCAPGVVRGSLDPRRNPRIRAAQLAAGESRHHQGAAQAVFQPAQDEEEPGLALGRRNARRRERPQCDAR